MTALTENPAVVNPMFALTARERDALSSIHHFRHHVRRGGFWNIGDKRFAMATVAGLERHGLISFGRGSLNLTTAGQLALDRIGELGK